MKSILSDKNSYRISGRTTFVGGVLYLGFSGSFVEFSTNSKLVRITIITDKELEEDILRARLAIFVNNNEPYIDTILNRYEQTFEFNLDEGQNTIRIEKYSEAAFGLIGIQKIEIDDNAVSSSTTSLERKIEFIGDSITCGYGVEAESELITFSTATENPEKAYAIKTARNLNAEYQLVSWSGIGTISDWVEETVNEPREEILMKGLYPYTDLRLSEKLGLPMEEWNHSSYVPDLIVINLGTNDDSYVRKIPERESEYKRTYLELLKLVHAKNPNTPILSILGIMGRNLCPIVAEAVGEFKKENPDVSICFVDMDEQDKENDGMGADYHPCEITHTKASLRLTEEIRKFMKNW